MKKKGFTLVELIAAIAIFAIVMSAVSLTFSTSIKTWNRADLKLEASTYSQSIIETLRSQGAAKIKTMYSDSVNGNSGYIFFDDNITNLSVYNNGTSTSQTDLSTWVKNSTTKLTGTVAENYSSCKINSNNKKYGASIFIKQSDSVNLVYYVRVKVWDLKRQNGADTESLKEIYISR